ncbi:NAD(P)-dependent oxidoreductase [Rhodococcus opacus]|uniref:NAD(P)-dependent oxidoreductase n=1 Tax=Rhodococcus opacus TaxID=37919 RepID=UPI002477164A|nr:NAD(P)-binding domain-containing protein [Rhodococcus opacus]MDH6288238.1 3-hydroxyisobutyrate dehydrogenase-like beta-hydroxyacid dehydrogenase [Rhodococcus opacus]
MGQRVTGSSTYAIAVLGGGAIGSRVAARLAAAGHNVQLLDPSDDARSNAAETGLRAHPQSGGWMRDIDVVVACLPGPDQIRTAVLGDDGLAGNTTASLKLYVEMSTCDLAVAVEVQEWCSDRGAAYVAAPVCGKPPTASLLVGCDPEHRMRWKGLLGTVADTLVDAGSAQDAITLKLLNQYVVLATQTALVAALDHMNTRGWSLQRTAEAMSHCTARGNVLDTLRKRVSGADDGSGSTALAYKDLQLVDGHFATTDDATPPMLTSLVNAFGQAVGAGKGGLPSWRGTSTSSDLPS